VWQFVSLLEVSEGIKKREAGAKRTFYFDGSWTWKIVT